MRAYAAVGAGLAVLVVALPQASAWEAETTHAGLAERSAEASSLHDRLAERFDLDLGLYAALAMSPGDAPALFEALATLNPAHGYAPDESGELAAVGWLVAGAVLANMPAEHAVHHAYDPRTGSGFSDDTLPGGVRGWVQGLGARVAGSRFVRSGMPATEWLRHAENPFSLAQFRDQYARAVSARTPAERERHAAAMLVAAGAIVHVVQDMASPARVRDDRAAFTRQIGRDELDVGSRFERLASLSLGRLGVPGPSREPSLRPALADYISAEDHSGLADRTSRRFMSHGTLPQTIEANQETSSAALTRRIEESLRRPSPRPGGPVDLRAAATDEGARLLGESGVCVAHYRLREGELRWRIPDRCALDQIPELLAEASAYGAGTLDWLFRGDLEVRREGDALTIAAGELGVRDASATLLWEDARGVRKAYEEFEGLSGEAGEVLASAEPPGEGEARRVVVLLRGRDEHGEPVAASGASEL